MKLNNPRTFITSFANSVFKYQGEYLKLYPYQNRLLLDSSPFRVVMKARQMGYSFCIAVEGLVEALLRPNITVLFVSSGEEAAKRILRYVYELIEGLPVKPQTIVRSTTECSFSNNSRLVSLPNNDRTVRGFRAHKVYCDEFASIMNDKEILAAIQPSISRGGEMTILSTPRGRANQFWEVWDDPRRSFSKHKAPWWICPDKNYAKMIKRIQRSMIDIDFRQEYCCVKPTTLVHCIDGMKPIQDITTDDEVLTHKGRFRKVLKTFKHQNVGELVKIKSYYNSPFPIEATPEHPILTDSGFKQAKDITKDDRITHVTRVTNGEITTFEKKDFVNKYDYGFRSKWMKHIPDSFDFTEELAELCGWYVAEGCRTANGRAIQFTLSLDEHEECLRIQSLIKKIFRVDSTIRARGPVYNVLCNCRIIANFFSQFGGLARNKYLPAFVSVAPQSTKSSFLNSYIKGDGWEDTDHYSITTASQQLMFDIRDICLQLGYTPHLKQGKHSFNYDGRASPETVCYQLGFSKEKSDSGKKFKKTEIGRDFRIKDISTEQYNGFVYNLEVEEDNTYTLAYATVHNCDPCATDLAFFTREMLEPIINYDAVYVNSLETKNKVVMGIDFGKKVSSTVITIAERCEDVVRIRLQEELRNMPYDFNLPGMTQLKRIAEIEANMDVDEINIDATGVGVRLEEDMTILFGAKVNPVIFSNKEKEIMVTNLRLLCEKQGIELVDDPEFISQLLSLEREYTPSGIVRYMHVKGKRDDRVWSACLAVKDMLSPEESLEVKYGEQSIADLTHSHIDSVRGFELTDRRLEDMIKPW